jgi:ABC-type multidrug transport system ATPase subunit
LNDLDEADLLSDRIAFISTGRIRAVGSPLDLKQQFGSGYVKSSKLSLRLTFFALRYTLSLHLRADAPRDRIMDRIKVLVAGAAVQDNNLLGMSILLPQQYDGSLDVGCWIFYY